MTAPWRGSSPAIGGNTPQGRYATIDVGSNTILLLVGEVTPEGDLKVIIDRGEAPRLGRGLREGGRLDPGRVKDALEVVGEFLSLCRQEGVEDIAAVGTNPLRIAADARGFIDVVRERWGVTLEVIDGEEEARLSYLSVVGDPLMPRDPLVIDIGGGSTEYIFREGNDLKFLSLPLGAVVLTEEMIKGDPPSEEEFSALRRRIEGDLSVLPSPWKGEAVAIGGTAVSLASFHLGIEDPVRERVHGLPLGAKEIAAIIEDLRRKNLDERRRLRGLPPERADIILAGAVILLLSLKRLKIKEVIISWAGIRYGLFYERFMGLSLT